MLAQQNPEQILETALIALSTSQEWRSVLDKLPVPFYTADASGIVTYWNRPCVEFAGREPDPARDRWIFWHIQTPSGDSLASDECPMALAVREQRPVRGVVAIAVRPNDSRIAYVPYPTPLFDREGRLTGAVNMLIDVTEEQSGALHEQAERCRRLAGATYDRATSKALGDMALGFDKTAERLAPKRTS